MRFSGAARRFTDEGGLMKRARVFCSYCGSRLVKKEEQDGKMRDYCQVCAVYYYENPLPVASTIVCNDQREILLVQRKKDPYKNMWCLPIGFAEAGEEVRDAALRELEEEAGVTGEIRRLIDVDTVENYYYGSLAIVTYEVAMKGGRLRPGDDAVDARFFPILDTPPLAWSSNEKAIRIYYELYKDTWAMMDSFRQLYPEIESLDTLASAAHEQKEMLSNILVTILQVNVKEISGAWIDEVCAKIPVMRGYRAQLEETNNAVLEAVQAYLQGESSDDHLSAFAVKGGELRALLVPLPELLTALALSRKSIWKHVAQKKILASPLEIYSTLELNNRIIFIYDKIIYHLTKGYYVSA